MGGGQLMKTTIHCDERITNIRNTIYVKLFWGIIILDNLTNLLDYFFQTSLNGWVPLKRTPFIDIQMNNALVLAICTMLF